MSTGGRLTRRAVLLAASLALACAAQAQDHPPTLPTRDVDITYIVPTPAGAARQRLRFSVALRALRIDPPGRGLYTIIDFAAGRMFTVREADRSVIDMAAPKTWMPNLSGGQSGTHYVRRNTLTLSGVTCTEWQTTDSEGRDVRICFDQDGVMHRASAQTQAGELVMAQATEFNHRTQDAAVFRVPAEYRRLAPPPIPGAR